MVMEIDNKPSVAKIKVIGVGGAGGNAVNRMVSSGFDGVEFIAINTDALALDNSLAERKISIGDVVTSGLGAGAKPEVGQEAILESREEVTQALQGADMVFITAGMGGGTGTGAAPVVAEICRELGILSVGVVTKPFLFEGPVRKRNCLHGLGALSESVDTIITIPNQKILSIADRNMSFKQAFAICDDVLTDAVRGISDIILNHGEIQVDFADVNSVMKDGGSAMMGTGLAEGENRAVVAAERAINSPLLDELSIEGANGLLVNITGGNDLGIMEINDAMSFIYEAVGEENEPNIIFGTAINESLEGKISVTVIATGFESNKAAPQVSNLSRSVTPQAVVAPEQPVVAPTIQKQSVEQRPLAQPSEPVGPILQSIVQPQQPVRSEPQASAAVAEMSNTMVSTKPQMQAMTPVSERVSPSEVEELETISFPSFQDVREVVVEESVISAPIPKANASEFFHETKPTVVAPVETVQPIVDVTMDDDIDYETPAFLRNQDV